jgi:uncharacterized protein (TIGR00255 family)
MIKSMTGFGKGAATIADKQVIIDVRALNSKQLDLNLKLPSIFREKEGEIRAEISKALERGKVDVFINIKAKIGTTESSFNKELIKSRYVELKSLAAELGSPETDFLRLAMQLPLDNQEEDETLVDADWKAFQQLLQAALNQLNDFRKDEGKGLETEVLQRVHNIQQLLATIATFENERVALIKTKLKSKLAELSVPAMDNNRLEEELIYYIEKLDISEEKQRLTTHCNYFIETAKEDTASGRKLGFITQEMGREINTIGSKANHAEMQKKVVLMKDELEKIKEQLNNIL